jgi:hypothetical protein
LLIEKKLKVKSCIIDFWNEKRFSSLIKFLSSAERGEMKSFKILQVRWVV